MQEQHHRGSLSQLIGDRTLASDAPGLLHEIGWEVGTIGRQGTWHDEHLFAPLKLVSTRNPFTLPNA